MVKLIFILLLISLICESFNYENTINLSAIKKLVSQSCENEGQTLISNCAARFDKIIILSTLNGKLTAVNLESGSILWSLQTDHGPLLTSSLNKMKFSDKDNHIWLVPSLNGDIYKFDEKSLEPVLISVDTLLNQPLHETGDVLFTGSKNFISYGINAFSGTLRYSCSSSGCSLADNNKIFLDEDIIVIRRNTKIVRAFEAYSGCEKWNFTASNLEVKYIPCSITPKTESYLFNLFDNVNYNHSTINPKILLSQGIIMGFTHNKELKWKLPLGSPITAAWNFDSDTLHPINIFELSMEMSPAPKFYLGFFMNQFYIQENLHTNNLLSSDTSSSQHETLSDHALVVFSDSINHFERSSIFNVIAKNSSLEMEVIKHLPSLNENCSNVFKNFTFDNTSDFEIDIESSVPVIIISVWYWWKEIIFISSVLAFLINALLAGTLMTKWRQKVAYETSQHLYKYLQRRGLSIVKKGSLPKSDSSLSISPKEEFSSRYLSDFEPLRCLGKGGFGVVFEARNKIDDCHYAVKRIQLPNGEESLATVLREVKALAKLDHPNIVRYFNAWIECPPEGWKINNDMWWRDSENALCSTPCNSVLSQKYSSHKLCSKQWKDSFSESNNSVLDNPNSDSFIIFKHSSQRSKSDSSFLNESSISSGAYNSAVKVLPVFLYIQMQLCQKESLHEWLMANAIQRDYAQVLNIFHQILLAVEYIHAKGMIHRDLKPSNIFFDMNGVIKVGDFGLVMDLQISLPDNLDNKTIKQYSAQVGTYLYMSPEQCQGHPYNHSVDIYALGLILFELLFPFMTQMHRIKCLDELRKHHFPSSFVKTNPKEYQLLKNMLCNFPEKRPSAAEIRNTLMLCCA